MNPFFVNHQRAWLHDEGYASGYFHTFDGLVVDPQRDSPRKVHIFLPRGYESSAHAYPVVYMNDGNTTFWADGLSDYSWQVHETLQQLYNCQKITPVIIVAIHPLNRSQEYLHTEEFSGFFRKEGGGLSLYCDYLVRLKQFIDRSYNTLSSRECTTIIGSSHGGLAAFYIGCIQGKHFGNVGALSSSFWVGGVYDLRQTSLIATLHTYLSPDNPTRPRMWIDWGLCHHGGIHNWFVEAQAAKWSEEMVRLLQEDYHYRLNEDLFCYADAMGGHDERAWAYRFGLILEKYYPFCRVRDASKR